MKTLVSFLLDLLTFVAMLASFAFCGAMVAMAFI